MKRVISTVARLVATMSKEEREEFDKELLALIKQEKKLAKIESDNDYIELNEKLAKKIGNKFKTRKKNEKS